MGVRWGGSRWAEITMCMQESGYSEGPQKEVTIGGGGGRDETMKDCRVTEL